MCENIYFEFIQSFFKRFIEERAFQHSRFPSLPFQKKKIKTRKVSLKRKGKGKKFGMRFDRRTKKRIGSMRRSFLKLL